MDRDVVITLGLGVWDKRDRQREKRMRRIERKGTRGKCERQERARERRGLSKMKKQGMPRERD